MKAKKLPSGRYRCRASITVDGKYTTKSFTADTAKKAEAMAYTYLVTEQKTAPQRIKVKDALLDYNELKKNVISPSTYREYEKLRLNAFPELVDREVQHLTQRDLQKWVNAQTSSEKTVRNKFHYLISAIKKYNPEICNGITLPQKEKPKYHIVSDAEIQALLADTAGTELGLAIRLAVFIPARRSEICALTKSDITGKQVSINKAMVLDRDKDWVIKPPKSYNGYRIVNLPTDIIDMIPNREQIIQRNPNSLYKDFFKEIKKLGFNFRFHDLRHYGCTFMHSLGIPDKEICRRAGMDIVTLQKIYEHSLPENESASDIAIQEKYNKLKEKKS